mmetsp:Transcript_79717/g.140681  ORF Transcript_79717/g.140681 Transcript_79717/m.140681 type:complete len:246 (+) Transcript_79717:51-788(+)
MASSRLLHGAAALVIAYSLLAACTTFVASTSSKGLRGVQGPTSSGAKFERFQSGMPTEDGSVESNWFSAANAVMLAGVVGLLAGMAPVRAEEVSGSVAEAQKGLKLGGGEELSAINAAEKTAPTKAERLRREQIKLAEDKLSQERAIKDVESAMGTNQTTNVTLKNPKRIATKTEGGAKPAAAAAVATPTVVPGKNKVIFSPADDLDEDELNPSRAGQGLLLAFYLLILPVTYIFFWVAGSLNVI